MDRFQQDQWWGGCQERGSRVSRSPGTAGVKAERGGERAQGWLQEAVRRVCQAGWAGMRGPIKGTAGCKDRQAARGTFGQSEQPEGSVTAAQSQGQAGSSVTLCLGQWPHMPCGRIAPALLHTRGWGSCHSDHNIHSTKLANKCSCISWQISGLIYFIYVLPVRRDWSGTSDGCCN